MSERVAPTRTPAFEKRFRAKKRAWAWFEAQPKGYRQNTIRWVMTAKREETRERRLAELITRSAKGEPIKLLDRRPPAAS